MLYVFQDCIPHLYVGILWKTTLFLKIMSLNREALDLDLTTIIMYEL